MSVPSNQAMPVDKAQDAPRAGMVVGGRYQLLTVIGTGGMSTVYLALDKVLNKQWAAKEIRRVEDPQMRDLIVKSIVTEANMIKRFDHPAIPRIVDIVDDAGTLYVIMDYVEGHALESILETMGPQPEDAVADWAIQLCDVLEYLHQLDPPIIYRDMKPSNVMLRPNGSVSVIDFGIARELHRDGGSGGPEDEDLLGTRGYAPPEQADPNCETDARSDVYSLGATMFSLLTGKNPADMPEGLPPVRQICPELSAGIELVIARATQPDPKDRYADCAEMAHAIMHRSDEDERRRVALGRTWKRFVGLAVVACIALAMGIVGTTGRIVMTNGDYDHWMEVGRQSSSTSEAVAAYERAAQIKPGETGAYKGLVGRFRDNGSFTTDEEAQLRLALLPNLAQVSSSKDYADLAFDIGKLYWYEFGVDPSEAASLDRSTQLEGRSARIRAAGEWMRAAASDPSYENHDIAQVYADIADFNSNIVPLINEGSDQGVYSPYFSNLQTLVSSMANSENDVMKLETANLVLDSLTTYPRKFRADGISEDDMHAVAGDARQLAEGVFPTTALLDAERASALSTADGVDQAIADSFVDARTVQQ
ncbi:MAG: serine/threonine protein kinase [Coriobacteriaceae bacterium]|nr:serine/threonine protein kinase [Coriobacteriaceae bacterium]MDY4535234.1 serine/threonine-protein kinase [Tractidigestivibacter sp.]